MTTAQSSQTIDIPFDDAGVSDLTGAMSGSYAGASGPGTLGMDDLAEFREVVGRLRTRGNNAAKSLICTANWTERSCVGAGAAGAQEKPAADNGVTVILTGAEPGGGTVNPAPGASTSPGASAAPESPDRPTGGVPNGSGETLDHTPQDGALATAFHRVGKGDGLLVVPRRGVYGARALLESKLDTAVKGGPLLDLGDDLTVPVGDGSSTCRTFGPNPQVIVLPPTRFFASAAVEIKGISVLTNLLIEVTPVRASFGRTGRCWEGVCSTEQLSGFVVSTVHVKATIQATGAIKIGPFKIGSANIALIGEVSLPRLTSYTLTTS